MRVPRSGDVVRARVDQREERWVEGPLYLQYVASRRYVAIHVLAEDRVHDVEPETIEVTGPGAVPIAVLQAADPLTGGPGWREVRDLAQAEAEGLVLPTRVREGGTWADLFAALDRLVGPLVAAGWTIEDQPGGELGVRRHGRLRPGPGGRTVGVGVLRVRLARLYDLSRPPNPDPDAEPDGPLLGIAHATPASAESQYRLHGWLDTTAAEEPT